MTDSVAFSMKLFEIRLPITLINSIDVIAGRVISITCLIISVIFFIKNRYFA